MQKNTSTPDPKCIKIMMVEDDVDLCEGWADVFELLGHQLVYHHRAMHALEDVENLKSSDVLISDFYLPDLNGVELVKKVHEICPELPTVILTGTKEASVVEVAKRLPNCTLLHKPINIEVIEKYLDEEIAKRIH